MKMIKCLEDQLECGGVFVHRLFRMKWAKILEMPSASSVNTNYSIHNVKY